MTIIPGTITTLNLRGRPTVVRIVRRHSRGAWVVEHPVGALDAVKEVVDEARLLAVLEAEP